MFTEAAKPLPEVNETSKSVGAVTVRSAVKFVPETLKLPSVEGPLPSKYVSCATEPVAETIGVVTVPIQAPGSKPFGVVVSIAPSPSPPSLSIFHSLKSQTGFPDVTVGFLSALPSSN